MEKRVKRWLVAAACAFSVFVGLTGISRLDSTSDETPPMAERLSGQLVSRFQKKVVLPRGGGLSEAIEAPALENRERLLGMLRAESTVLYRQADFYDKEAIYQEQFESWERRPGMLETAADLVAQPGRYQDMLGHEQAIARTYAVRYLLSRQDADEQVLRGVMARLIEGLEARGEEVAGQAYDLEVVAKAIIERTLGTQELTPENASLIAHRLVGPTKRLSRTSAKAVSLAFFGHALRHNHEENARAIARSVRIALNQDVTIPKTSWKSGA